MSEMVEHVARALIEAHGDHEAMPADDYLRMARAAITAMREPTEEMHDAGTDCGDWGPPGYFNHTNGEATPDNCWRAMIDAALTQ